MYDHELHPYNIEQIVKSNNFLQCSNSKNKNNYLGIVSVYRYQAVNRSKLCFTRQISFNAKWRVSYYTFIIVIAISVVCVRYLGCCRIRTYDMLIINIGVINARTDGQTFLFQLFTVLAE